MSTDDKSYGILALVQELTAIQNMLAPYVGLADDEVTPEVTQTLVSVYDHIHGQNDSRRGIPWDERLPELRDLVPDGVAWCVIQTYDPKGSFRSGEAHVWPGMVFSTKKKAKQWRDFLEDFYGPRDTWTVEFTYARIMNFTMGKESSKVGTGYSYTDRRRDLPAPKYYRHDRDKGWVRIKKEKAA